MVKRIAARKATWVALLGILVLTGLLMAVSPPNPQEPAADADETRFEITEGEASAVHGETADGTAIAIVWGEGVDGGDLPTASVVPVDDEAKARYQNIPAEILDQLPDNVRSTLDAHFGVSGALNSQQQDWWCALTVPPPYEDEDNNLVRNTQNLDCGGEDLHKIRLRSKVERRSGSIWYTLTDYDSGWLTNTGIENNVDNVCPAGTFDYRAKGYGRVMLTDWSVISFNNTSGTTEIAC